MRTIRAYHMATISHEVDEDEAKTLTAEMLEFVRRMEAGAMRAAKEMINAGFVESADDEAISVKDARIIAAMMDTKNKTVRRKDYELVRDVDGQRLNVSGGPGIRRIGSAPPASTKDASEGELGLAESAQRQAMEAEMAALRVKLDSLQSRLDLKERELAATKKSLETHSAQATVISKTNTRQEHDVDRLHKEVAVATDRIAMLNDRINALEAELRSVRSRYDQEQRAAELARTERDRVQVLVEERDDQLTAAKGKISALSRALKDAMERSAPEQDHKTAAVASDGGGRRASQPEVLPKSISMGSEASIGASAPNNTVVSHNDVSVLSSAGGGSKERLATVSFADAVVQPHHQQQQQSPATVGKSAASEKSLENLSQESSRKSVDDKSTEPSARLVSSFTMDSAQQAEHGAPQRSSTPVKRQTRSPSSPGSNPRMSAHGTRRDAERHAMGVIVVTGGAEPWCDDTGLVMLCALQRIMEVRVVAVVTEPNRIASVRQIMHDLGYARIPVGSEIGFPGVSGRREGTDVDSMFYKTLARSADKSLTVIACCGLGVVSNLVSRERALFASKVERVFAVCNVHTVPMMNGVVAIQPDGPIYGPDIAVQDMYSTLQALGVATTTIVPDALHSVMLPRKVYDDMADVGRLGIGATIRAGRKNQLTSLYKIACAQQDSANRGAVPSAIDQEWFLARYCGGGIAVGPSSALTSGASSSSGDRAGSARAIWRHVVCVDEPAAVAIVASMPELCNRFFVVQRHIVNGVAHEIIGPSADASVSLPASLGVANMRVLAAFVGDTLVTAMSEGIEAKNVPEMSVRNRLSAAKDNMLRSTFPVAKEKSRKKKGQPKYETVTLGTRVSASPDVQHTQQAGCPCTVCKGSRLPEALAAQMERSKNWEASNALRGHIKLGDRVQLDGGLLGFVKYVGRVDSDYIDYQTYVGVKLDDPAGDCDGVYKGKRYFTCPDKHGMVVPVSRIASVYVPKSMTFQPSFKSWRLTNPKADA
eukprot:Opistho-2@12277